MREILFKAKRLDNGGCDRYFAAFAKVKVQCESKAIEGC